MAFFADFDIIWTIIDVAGKLCVVSGEMDRRLDRPAEIQSLAEEITTLLVRYSQFDRWKQHPACWQDCGSHLILAPPHKQCPEYRSKRMSCCPRWRHPYLHAQWPAGSGGDEDAVTSSKTANQQNKNYLLRSCRPSRTNRK
uniref:GG16052 n=1 Tax=Drosophila erecta TaxID=7220 RepID=B3P351_DROER